MLLCPLYDLLPYLDELRGQYPQLGLVALVVGQSGVNLISTKLIMFDNEPFLLLDDSVIVLYLLQQPVLVLDDRITRRFFVHELLELEDSRPLWIHWLPTPFLRHLLLDLFFLA